MLTFKKKTPIILDAQEAFNIWDMLRTRYDAIEQIQVFQNFIHDIDFNILVKVNLYGTFEKQVNELEKLMDDYGISLPRRPPKSVRTPANTEAIEDRFVATLLMTILQENVDMHLRAIRTSLTSDNLRKLFMKYLKNEMIVYSKAVKYVKLKGWFGSPPLYLPSPHNQQDKLDSGEAFHLWDHLTSRYDTLETTQIFKNFAHDPDFKTVLLMGLATILQKQIDLLEKEMNRYSLPLTDRPPKSTKPVTSTDILEDEWMYRQVFTGIQFMIDLHATALKQNTTNDRLRDIYENFLWDELDTLDDWVKYGKAKGWLRHAPMYKTSL
ncbi:MAG: DUF3231 family protein [Peptococcaceae bacterium]